MPHAMTDDAQPSMSAETKPLLSSAAILNGSRKVLIRHGEDLYTLQVTRQGKLLLNK